VLREGYGLAQLRADALAGLTVAIVGGARVAVRKLVIALLLAAALYGWHQSNAPRWETPAFAAEPVTLRATAVVVDGDSLELGGTRIRLHAIDAPEGKQQCTRNSVSWACGEEAARKLRTLVGTHEITCTRTDTDSYGRTVAICKNGSVDIGAEMVSAGLALAYRQYGNDYVALENAARAAKRGLWAGEFTPPWDYRHGTPEGSAQPNRRTQDGTAPPPPPTRPQSPAASSASPEHRAGCAIKGNISQSSGDRIYHLPGTRDYDATRINPSAGERWFCTEQEAQTAGWRAPRG